MSHEPGVEVAERNGLERPPVDSAKVEFRIYRDIGSGRNQGVLDISGRLLRSVDGMRPLQNRVTFGRFDLGYCWA
jgi:hypothetical protein